MRAVKARQLRNLAAHLATRGYGPELATTRPRRLLAAIQAGHISLSNIAPDHISPAARLLYPGRDDRARRQHPGR